MVRAAVALALISKDTKRIDLEMVEKGMGPLSEKEMKGLLTDCLALEPQLAMLLLIDDELRMERALKRLDRLSSSEKRFGIPVSLLRYD